MSHSFKIAVVGGANVGKGTYANLLWSGNYEEEKVKAPLRAYTIECVITNRKMIKLHLFITSTDEALNWIPTPDACIGMCRTPSSVIVMEEMIKHFKTDCVIRIATKADTPNTVTKDFYKKSLKDDSYVLLSSKSRYNFEAPLKFIIRKLLKDQTLEILDIDDVKEDIKTDK